MDSEENKIDTDNEKKIRNREYYRLYRIKNRDIILEKDRARNESRREYQKQWKIDNDYSRKVREKRHLLFPPVVLTESDLIERDILRKKKKSEYQKKYRNSNGREVVLSYRRRKRKERRINDKVFALQERIRARISTAFKRNNFRKSAETERILGCSFSEAKKYLESKFEPWMNWENAGLYNGEINYGWDIDHIIPISYAKTEEDVILLNHYTNLQPLCSYINRSVKQNKIIYETPAIQ